MIQNKLHDYFWIHNVCRNDEKSFPSNIKKKKQSKTKNQKNKNSKFNIVCKVAL